MVIGHMKKNFDFRKYSMYYYKTVPGFQDKSRVCIQTMEEKTV
jgi:hypothetical protein